MKKNRCGLSESKFKRLWTALLVLCCSAVSGTSVAAMETVTVQVDGTQVQVIDAGEIMADVVKEVLPHPLLPYQTYNITAYNGVASPSDSFFMMGQEYFQGAAYSNYDGGRFVYYNLEQKCSHVSFLAGHIDDGRSGEAVLYIYADGTQVQTVELTPDMITKEIVLDTTEVTQLVFQIEGTDSSYGLAQVYGYGYDCHNYKKEMSRMVSAVTDGIYTYTCVDCGYTYEEMIPSQSGCEPYLLPYQSSEVKELAATEDPTDCVYVMGKPIYRGLVFDCYNSPREALYNLGQAYKNVAFRVGHIDNLRKEPVTLRVFADGMQMKELELTSGMISQEVMIDTTGVTQLKLSFEGYDASYAVYDMEFVPVTEHGHSFEREVVLEPSVGMTGICSYTCQYCGASYSETIPALKG